jgi:hypothetical protein
MDETEKKIELSHVDQLEQDLAKERARRVDEAVERGEAVRVPLNVICGAEDDLEEARVRERVDKVSELRRAGEQRKPAFDEQIIRTGVPRPGRDEKYVARLKEEYAAESAEQRREREAAAAAVVESFHQGSKSHEPEPNVPPLPPLPPEPSLAAARLSARSLNLALLSSRSRSLSEAHHVPLAVIAAIRRTEPLKPVIFPPGFAKLATTISGSPIAAMTMGVVVVAFFAARTAGVPLVTITSTFKRTKSVASSANRSPRPSAERYSITRFCSSMYPRARKLWRNASKFAAFNCIDVVSSTPMRQTLPGCCARAATGHAIAAPPKSVMNSRRLM